MAQRMNASRQTPKAEALTIEQAFKRLVAAKAKLVKNYQEIAEMVCFLEDNGQDTREYVDIALRRYLRAIVEGTMVPDLLIKFNTSLLEPIMRLPISEQAKLVQPDYQCHIMRKDGSGTELRNLTSLNLWEREMYFAPDHIRSPTEQRDFLRSRQQRAAASKQRVSDAVYESNAQTKANTSGVFVPLSEEELIQLEIAASRENLTNEDFIIDCLMRLRVFKVRAIG